MVVTQGLLFGLGLLVLEMPTLIILNSWFVKRRGLAYGVLYGLTDLFGVAWGFLADALLKHHGIRATFLVFAGICFVIPAIALFFLRERPPATTDTGSEASSFDNVPATVLPQQDATGLTRNRPYYRSATFYILLASNLFQAFAFYLPFIYLPSYTTALGHSSSTGAIVLAVANIAQVFGEVGFGRLSDKINVHSLVFCSALVASLSAFSIWSFATSLAYLIPFALLFGSFGSGFLSLWPRMGTLYGEVDASMIFSIMSFGRGFGVIASGPISTALLQRDLALATQPPRSVRHDYRPVVLFVGGCMAASATLGLLGWLMSHWNSKMLHKGCERTETTV
jgi:MFS family permease